MSLLQGLFKSPAQKQQEAREAAIADPVIDRIVAATDKRLMHVKELRRGLRGPVIAARTKLADLIAGIPGPVEMSPATWARDDTVRALFARAGDTAEAFSRDEATRAFFALHPGAACVGLLALERVERRVIASALQGDQVQADVARTTVSFREPRVLAPGADEVAARGELVHRAFEYLGLRALQRVGAMRAQRHEMEQERSLLQAQLRLARRNGAGFGGLDVSGESKSTAELERDLERVVGELEAAASQSLLPLLVEAIADVLAHFAEHLTIEPSELSLDAMNFIVPAAEAAVRPRVAILRLAERGPFAVVLARFPCAELRAIPRFDDAAKFL